MVWIVQSSSYSYGKEVLHDKRIFNKKSEAEKEKLKKINQGFYSQIYHSEKNLSDSKKRKD